MQTRSPSPETVSMAVIGCGNFACRQHLPYLQRFGNVRLACVCDVKRETALRAAHRFGAETTTQTWQAVAEDPGITAVVVAVRDDLQADIAEGMLQAGKHVYLEKPGATSEAEFDRLIRARDRQGTLAVVGFQKRFAPAYRALREVFAVAGPPRNLFCRMADDAWRWAKGYPPGALLRHDACHLFDLLRYLTASEMRAMHAFASRPDDDALLMQFMNGTTATLMQSGHASMDFPKERMEAILDRGAVTMEDFVEVRTYGITGLPAIRMFPLVDPDTGKPLGQGLGLQNFQALRRRAWEDWQAEGGTPKVLPNFLRDQGWGQSLARFVAAVQSGEPDVHATLEDARAASRMAQAAEAAQAAAASGAALHAGQIEGEA